MIAAIILLFALAVPTNEQTILRSPCPNVFQYERPQTVTSSNSRWYGVVDLSTNNSPQGLLLDITLDRKVDSFGTWAGEVSTQDNINFRIENSSVQISPGAGTIFRFYVQYSSFGTVPAIKAIKLSGTEICNVIQTPENYDTVNRPINTDRPSVSQSSWPIYFPGNNADRPQSNPFGNVINVGNNNNFQNSQQPVFSQTTSTSSPVNTNFNVGNELVQCGTVVKDNNANYLILQGLPTTQGQWPWQTALYVSEREYNKYTCGGTLVGQRHVVTAAHCVTKRKHKKAEVIDENTLTVYLGKHNLRTTTRGVQIKLVENIIVHPEYKLPEFKCDIAIIELLGKVEYTDWVRPACLWPETLIDLENVVWTNGWVVGWGIDESGVVSEELTMVQMPVVNQETCLRSHESFFTRFTSEYTYCAGNRDGSSVCNGDSGGGMVFQRDSLWYLRGVVSLSLAKEKRCDPKHFVIFTDVAKLLPWVKQNIN